LKSDSGSKRHNFLNMYLQTLTPEYSIMNSANSDA
jgi:hypothetical protein